MSRERLFQLTLLMLVSLLFGNLNQPILHADSAERADQEIFITDSGFSPTDLTIEIGTTVTWTNNSSTVQQVKSGPAPDFYYIYLPLIVNGETQNRTSLSLQTEGWDSGRLDPGESFTYTFTEIGDFTYHNPLNIELEGTVNVTEVQVERDPTVTITEPVADAVVAASDLTVRGTVDDNDPIASVTVNDVAATITGDAFEAVITLTDGNQTIEVVATDEDGNVGLASRVVLVDGTGPEVAINEPQDQDAIYSTTPAVNIDLSDYRSEVDDASIGVALEGNGTTVDVTDELTISAEQISGNLSTLAEDQVYSLIVTLTDTLGNATEARSTFYVPEDADNITPPGESADSGFIAGTIFDSATCTTYQTECDGLAGAQVTLERIDVGLLREMREARAQAVEDAWINEGRQLPPMDESSRAAFAQPQEGTVITGPDGSFEFPVSETGIYWLRVERNGFTYGQREAQIVRDRSTASNDIYLTPIDSAVSTCDDAGCLHTSSDDAMQIDIPAGAVPNGQSRDVTATEFDNVEYLPSGDLPPNTYETYAFNVSGDSGMVFDQPVTIRQRNARNFDPGQQIPLGYWNPTLQMWEHAGIGTVDATGEWVEMEVTHFSNYDINMPIAPPEDTDPDADDESDDDEDDCGEGEGGCFIDLKNGTFEEEISVPSVEVLGENIAPTVIYNTRRVEPNETIDVKLSLDLGPGAEVGEYIGFELFIQGETTDNFTFEAPLDGGEVGRYRYLWNGRDADGDLLEPGVYDYQIRFTIPYTTQYCFALNGIFGNPPDCVNGGTGRFFTAENEVFVNGTVEVDTQTESAYGAGWVVDQHQRLYEDDAGNIMIADGRRHDEFYFPGRDQLLIQRLQLRSPVYTNSRSVEQAEKSEKGEERAISVPNEVARHSTSTTHRFNPDDVGGAGSGWNTFASPDTFNTNQLYGPPFTWVAVKFDQHPQGFVDDGNDGDFTGGGIELHDPSETETYKEDTAGIFYGSLPYRVDQKTYSNDTDDGSHWVLLDYGITNEGSEQLTNGRFMLKLDWDIFGSDGDKQGFDETRQLIMQWDDNGSETCAMGLALIDGALGGYVGTGYTEIQTDSTREAQMLNPTNLIAPFIGDVAMSEVAFLAPSLSPGETTSLSFVMAGACAQSESEALVFLQEQIDDASSSFDPLRISSRTSTDYSTLAFDVDTNTYTRTYLDGTQVHFNSDGSHDFTLSPDGRKLAYTYNEDGSIATMTITAPGHTAPSWVWTFQYSSGKLTGIVDPAGRTTAFNIGSRGDLLNVTTPDGASQQMTYDARHLMTHYTDQNGDITRHDFDQFGRITTLTEPPRAIYDPATDTTTVRREVKTFTPSDVNYALLNDSETGDPDNPAPAVPKTADLIDSVDYERGGRSGVTNQWGNWLQETDAIGRTTDYERDGKNNLTKVTYPDGDCVELQYDGRGNRLRQTEVAASQCNVSRGERDQSLVTEYRFVYESRFNNIKQMTDPLGNVTTYIYDYEIGVGEAGHLVQVIYPAVEDETRTVVTPTLTMTYNALGLVETVTDERDVVTKYVYTTGAESDGTFATGVTAVPGLLTQIIEDFGDSSHRNSTTTYRQFDGAGNPQQVIEPRGEQVGYAYDGMNRVTQMTNGLGFVNSYQYDGIGNVTRQVEGDAPSSRNRETLFTYNADDQMLQMTTLADDIIWQETQAYDVNGKLAKQFDNQGRTTLYGYDDADQLISITDPLGRITQYTYTDRGELASQIYPDGRTVTFAYDERSNLAELTPPSQPTHFFDHTPRDLVSDYTPPDIGIGNTSTTYTYNELQQLTSESRPDGRVITTAYDDKHRVASVTMPRGSLTFEYDPATSQMTRITAPDNVVTTYGYDDDLVDSMTWSGAIAGTVGMAYDEQYRVTSETVNGSTVNFGYSDDHLLTQVGAMALTRNAESGLLAGSILGSVTEGWTYNEFGELVDYAAGDLFGVSYTYDSLGRIDTLTDTIDGTAVVYDYEYDVSGRLIEVSQDGAVIQTYVYDDNGNRTAFTDSNGTLSATYDDQDRLTQYGDNAYTYTANGELTSKTTGSATTTYNYDVFSNLMAVTLSDGTEIAYLIDGENRRVGKLVDGSLVQGFLYQDALNPIAELDGSGNVVARFVYGTRSNVPDYMVKGGTTYRILSDHLGSVRFVVNTATGDVAQAMRYDAFGNVLEDTNPGFQPFGFAGGIYDTDTGLVRFGARDYDAEIGRWTTKDPISFLGGEANLFAYVSNDPINAIDKLGLTASCPSSPPRSNPNWTPYKGDPDYFHCGYEGYLENRNPIPEDPAQECFYDETGDLVDENHPYADCGGTANQYPASEAWDHTFNDSGGIVEHGWGAYWESRGHGWDKFWEGCQSTVDEMWREYQNWENWLKSGYGRY